MGDDLYESAFRLFSLLAHPARLRILDMLWRGAACVCHLQAGLEVSQPYVSQQLRVLREAGLISQRREGLYVYYQLTDPQVKQLLAEVLGQWREPRPSRSAHARKNDRMSNGNTYSTPPPSFLSWPKARRGSKIGLPTQLPTVSLRAKRSRLPAGKEIVL